MFRGSRVWAIVAAVYAAINLAGAGYALAMGEIPHAALHVVLLPGTYFFLWLARRNNAQGALAAAGGGGRSGAFDDRLSQLEQSVDAVAIEVERIGEGQRFMTRVMTENAGARPPVDNARVQPDEGERDS
jgi:hypothetical protein